MEIIQSTEATASSTGISEVNVDLPELKLFPNPTNSIATVLINDNNGVDGNIEITNSLGEVIYTTMVNPGNKQLDIDVSGFSSGIYHVVYKNTHSAVFKKLQILK